MGGEGSRAVAEALQLRRGDSRLARDSGRLLRARVRVRARAKARAGRGRGEGEGEGERLASPKSAVVAPVAVDCVAQSPSGERGSICSPAVRKLAPSATSKGKPRT